MKLTIRDWKIFACIKELNEAGVYANTLGLFKILTGQVDYDTKGLEILKTFSIYKSIRPRDINSSIKRLSIFNLIDVVLDDENEEAYYLKNERGEKLFTEYLSHHKFDLKKVKNQTKICIKKIPNKS